MAGLELFLFFVMWPFIVIFIRKSKYDKSSYKKETENSFFQVWKDKGLYGEYLTVKELDNLKENHKILVNVYLPNGRGGTTEVDVVLLHPMGIFALESKNYSGWILGREEDKKWCQSLPNGKKTFFYNPIKQNRSHIKALQRALPDLNESLFKSIIVFSERCELKKISLQSDDIKVLKRNKLVSHLGNQPVRLLSSDQLDTIYNSLKGFTKVSEETKKEHIQQIQKKYKNR